MGGMLFRSPIEQIFFNAMMQGKVFLDFFVYSAQWNTLGANATTLVATAINSDSDFVIQQLQLISYSAAGTIVQSPDYRITIVDAGSGRQLMDSSQHIGNITGSNRDAGAFPYTLPMAKLIRQGSSISTTLLNNTGTASLVDLSFVGFKVFYQGSWTRQQVIGIS